MPVIATKKDHTRGGAFTLVELLVVIVIMMLLVFILVKGVSVIQNRAQIAECASKIKSIGQVVRSYIADNKGFTPTHDASYPALFDMPLRWEAAYDQGKAFKTREFVCPLDRNPYIIESGYPSSYQMSSAFVNRNIVDLGTTSRLVMFSELGKRHRNGGIEACIYLFSDLRFEVTGTDRAAPGGETLMPGLYCRWYKESSLKYPAYEPKKEIIWSGPLSVTSGPELAFLPKDTYDSSSGWQAIPEWDLNDADEPRMILGIWVGYIDFPSAGTWTFEIQASGQNDCELSIGGNVIARGGGTTSGTYDASQPGKVEFSFRFTDQNCGFPGSFFRLMWSKASSPVISMQPVPADRFYHQPFVPKNVQN